MYSFIVFKYVKFNLTERKILFRENWLIFWGIWEEAELVLRIWGANENTFRELRNFLSGTWGDQRVKVLTLSVAIANVSVTPYQ